MQKQFQQKIDQREAEMRNLTGRKNEIAGSSAYNRLKLTSRSDGQSKDFANMNRQIAALDQKIEDCKTDILAWQQIVATHRSHGQAQNQAAAKSFNPVGINERNAAAIRAKVTDYTNRLNSGEGLDAPVVRKPKPIQPVVEEPVAPPRRILPPESPPGWVPPAERRRLAAEAAASAPPPIGPNEYMKAVVLDRIAKNRKGYREGDVITSDNRLIRATPVLDVATPVDTTDTPTNEIVPTYVVQTEPLAAEIAYETLFTDTPKDEPSDEADEQLTAKIVAAQYGSLGLDDL